MQSLDKALYLCPIFPMNRSMRRKSPNLAGMALGVAAALFGATAAAEPPGAATPPLHFADYDAELRLTDGRVDTERMTQRLKTLGVTKYYWLVWHAATDWEDLKVFLPKAKAARIEVWVYLVPPSEGPPGGYPASEPFKLDYLRWAQEIAQLSVQHTNLTGWVIDDFYANHTFFTPDYVRKMQARAKGINPRLGFLPLMYFPEITRQFVDSYGRIIDGVVVAYPQDREEILHARRILNGESSSLPGQFSCPGNTATQPGDFISASIPARVQATNHVVIRFEEQDDFAGATAGYHFKQLTIDGAAAWEQDVAGGTAGWHHIEVNAAPQVQGKTNVTLAFRLLDKKGVSNFGVRWRIKNLRTEGLQTLATLEETERWKVAQRGPFEAGFGPTSPKSESLVHVPFIVMTAASVEEFRLRHGDPASAGRIADWLKMSLQCWREGQCDGVVTYCLDKRPESPVFPLAQELFRKFNPKNSAGP